MNFVRLAHRAQLLKPVSFSFFAEVEVGVLSKVMALLFCYRGKRDRVFHNKVIY